MRSVATVVGVFLPFHLGLLMTAESYECAVVGCGVLGTSLCRQMMASPEFADWKVTGITKTNRNHKSIIDQVGDSSSRFTVKTADECRGETFQNVVFCAPPSGFDDYPGAVGDAAKNTWKGEVDGGVFVFTSSGGIYGSKEMQEVVNEYSELADPETNPRAARLIHAEEAARECGGACMRLAGLYSLERGAHNFWLTSGKDVNGRPDGIINLLHYDDAAGAVMAALLAGPSVVRGKNFLISDGNPTTREEICLSALKAKVYSGKSLPIFLGSDNDPIGKVYDGSASNQALRWDPRYISFDSYMSSQI